MPSHQPLSSFPPVLERIAYFADTSTRLTLLRTTYQLHHLVGPLVYREVYLDKKTRAGVFLWWDVEESPVDGEGEDSRNTEDVKNGSKRLIQQVVTAIASGGGKPEAKKQGKDEERSRKHAEANGQAKGAGEHMGPNDDYKPINNFKAALLRHVKIATMTQHDPTHCQLLADGGASALLSLDVLRVVQAWVNPLKSLERLCEGHNSCPLMLALDTKKIVLSNVKCSGFPLDIVDMCSWRLPSLQQAVYLLAADGSMTYGRHLQLEVNRMFIDIDRVKIVFLDSTETTAWDVEHYVPLPHGMSICDIAPVYPEDLLGIVRGAQQPGRVLEIYGLEELELKWEYSSRTSSGVKGDPALVKRVREELEKRNAALKNPDTNLIFGTLDDYLAAQDLMGEVNKEEIVSRNRHRQSVKRQERREARWIVERVGLRAAFEAGALQNDDWAPNHNDFKSFAAPSWFCFDDPEGTDSDDDVTF